MKVNGGYLLHEEKSEILDDDAVDCSRLCSHCDLIIVFRDRISHEI